MALGIYVGYKFYETADAEQFINYEEVVQYPFGYGLSYTQFSQEMTNFSDEGDSITFDVVVTNTGNTAGKDVVEVYYTPPYTNGGIEKASVNLIDFAKTQTLEAGESQTISFALPKEDMASYDSLGIKTSNGGYVLEAGEYAVSVRSDSHTVLDEEIFTVESDIDYSENGRESDLETAVNRFQEYSAGEVTYLSRADSFANYEEATAAPSDDMYVMSDEVRAAIVEKSVAQYDPSLYDNADDEMPVTGADNGLTLADMTGLDYDDPQWELLLDQLTTDEMVNLVNLGGFQTVAVESVDKPMVLDSDGTSGLNDWYVGVYGTAFPTEVLIAQTWNKDLAYRIGETEGQEYADARIFGTYSPAMNIHRTAFGGRNFEYYSEDPVISGYMAANTVNGLQTRGVYAFIKHFVMNDQELNRCTLLQTYADEQTMRELYMKPFEIAVKNFEGNSLAVMTSFNFIGTQYAGSDANLIEGVLRGEWGFRGFVLTDWDGSYGYQNTEDVIRNGGDSMLGFNQHESNVIENVSPTLAIAMRRAAKNIFYTVANSGNYTVEDPNAGKMDNLTRYTITANVIVVVVLLAALLLAWVPFLKRRRAA